MLLGLLFSVLGTALTSTHLLTWSFLVLGTLSATCWLKDKLTSVTLALFFVVSCLGGLMFLLASGPHFISALLLQLALLLKLGFAPFQFWVFKVLPQLDLVSVCLFLGPLKFGYLFLLASLSSSAFFLYLASLFVGLLVLYLSSSLQLVLYASGAAQLVILIALGPDLMPVYLLIYVLALFGIGAYEWGLVSPLFGFLSLGGLPPLAMFWPKAMALVSLPPCFGVLVLFVSVSSLFPYLLCSISLSCTFASSQLFCSLLSLVPCSLVSLFA